MIETKIDNFISDSLEPDVKNEITFQCNIGNYFAAIENLCNLLKESLDNFIYEPLTEYNLSIMSCCVEKILNELVSTKQLTKTFVDFIASNVYTIYEDYQERSIEDFVIKSRKHDDTVEVNWPRVVLFLKRNL
jgi:hypothetical protein